MAEWSFLTDHARVLLCIVQNPQVRLRDIAAVVDITERSAYAIAPELAEAGCLIKNKDGRRNHHEIQGHLPLRGTIGRERTISEVLDVLVEAGARRRGPPMHEVGASHLPSARAWRPWSESAI
jgi:hypothetical protein